MHIVLTAAGWRLFDKIWEKDRRAIDALFAGFIVTTVFGLWAWNTLSELYSGPVAQYKHVVAALILLTILRWRLHRASHK